MSEALSAEDLKAIRERDAAAFKAVDAHFKPCGSYDGNEVRGLLVSLFCKGWGARDTEIARLSKIEERAKECLFVAQDYSAPVGVRMRAVKAEKWVRYILEGGKERTHDRGNLCHLRLERYVITPIVKSRKTNTNH